MTHDASTSATPARFTASPELSARLQQVLVDLIALSLQGKQAHWTLVGRNFRDLHLQLDEIVDQAREYSDTIAERMRALGAVPDGRAGTVAQTTSLAVFPLGEPDTLETAGLITERLWQVTGTVRGVHDAVDAEDPTTADLLHVVIEGLEKQAWMLGAETR